MSIPFRKAIEGGGSQHGKGPINKSLPNFVMKKSQTLDNRRTHRLETA